MGTILDNTVVKVLACDMPGERTTRLAGDHIDTRQGPPR